MVLRTILLIIGVLIILGIAFDGWRRKRRRLQKSAMHNIEPTIHGNDTQRDNAENVLSEPDGSSKTDIGASENDNAVRQPGISAVEPTVDSAAPLTEKHEEKVSHLKPNPVKIETIESQDPANQAAAQRAAPRLEAIFSANETIPVSKTVEKPKQEVTQTMADMDDVITLTVMSINSRPFAGYDLIKALEENHLHHGEFDIYHRHKYKNGKGPLYFSVASVVNPGVLDPKSLGTLSTPGLALFMRLNNRKHDRIVFKQILATAHQLAKSLGGVVCDTKRVPLREATLQSYAERLDL